MNRKNIQIETDKSMFSLENEFGPAGKKYKETGEKNITKESNRSMMEVSINLPTQTMIE